MTAKRKILLIAALILLGSAALFTLQKGAKNEEVPNATPRDGSSPILTIRRADAIPDGTQIARETLNKEVLGFTVTNHSTSTSYAIDSFAFYSGLANNYPVRWVKQIRVYADDTLLGQVPAYLDFSGLATSTPAFVLPPLVSKTFIVRANFPLVATSAPSFTFQIAIGWLFVREASEPYGEWHQQVYKEMDGRALGSPYEVTDESIESAGFEID